MNFYNRLRAAKAGFMGLVPAIFGGPEYTYSDGITNTTNSEKYLKAYRGWVFGAVRIIASTAAAGRVRFYVDQKNGGKKYLEDNGFDGLFNPGECSCPVDRLFLCDGPCDECEPGYRVEGCTCGNGCDYHICREKPTSEVKP